MNKFFAILAVILFWVATITLAPIVITVFVGIFLTTIFIAISSLVYEIVIKYLEKKK
jgi:hypothetical protein